MSLTWYLHRLRAMSVGELAHRIAEKARKERARGRLEGWARYPGAEVLPLPGLRERLLAAPQPLRQRIRQAAEIALSGRYSALGVAWPQRRCEQLFDAEVWRLDPVTGGQWPGAEAYCFDIAYRHERRLGDIKYVWEFNRLQFLQPLAAHALLASDTASLAAIEAAIGSWHDANPPFRGLGWNSGIEVALRTISLLVVVSLVGEQLSSDCRRRVGSILAASAVWLGRFPSRFSSANNHLVAELAGEFLIGLAMPALARSARRVTWARTRLVEEATRQILADGVPAEQSPTYGAFTAEFLLLCAAVAEAAGQPLPPALGDRLRAFSDFIGWIALDDGTVPAIGDDDEGRVLTLGGHEAAYPGSIANAIAGFLGRGAGTAVPAGFREALLGRPAAARLTALAGLRVFETGGYSVVNEPVGDRRLSLVFDHGPLGYLSIAAHGHADALALTLAVDGRPVLVDPGTYLYHSGGAWRDWFRGSLAHNTLTIADADQSTISGAFNWSHKATSRLEHRGDGARWSLSASHDGYLKRFGVVHRRSIERIEDGLVITDQLLGAAARPARLAFQLAPDLEAEIAGREVVVCRNGSPVLTLAFEIGELSIDRGVAGGGAGWVSPAFGTLVPAGCIVWRGVVGASGRRVAVRPASAVGSTGVTRRLETA